MKVELNRANLLLEVKRYKDAEAALREALSGDPQDAHAHALLAIALYHQERNPEALGEAQAAISLEPDEPYNHYILAWVLLGEDGTEGRALAAIQEALRLNPQNPHYHAILSRVYARKKSWSKALKAAEAGLRLDPEHVECANLRGQALLRLGRKDEAERTIAAALARDPENAMTHATQGWASLHRGEQKGAFVHFREALRLNPMSNQARAGIVEALKARNPVYCLILRYFLWMSGLTTEEQVGVISGIYALRVTLNTMASGCLPLWLLVLPLNLLYQFFVTLTWIARPFFALLLRFDRFGRLALPEEEIAASNWLVACLLAAGISTIAGLLLGNIMFLIPVLVALSMIVPVAAIFDCPPGSRRTVLIAYAALLSQLGLGVFLLVLAGYPVALGLAVGLAVLFILGRLLYTWAAIILIGWEE